MATIPMGNFGQAVARGPAPAPGPLPDVMGQAAARTGQIALGAANDMAEQDTKLQEQRRRADAALALAKTTNELHDLHDQVARGVLDGSVPADAAQADFRKQAAKVREKALSGYMPEQRALMDGHIEQQLGAMDRGLGAVVEKRRQQETASAIDQFGEQVSREAARAGPGWASGKFDSFVDFTAGAAGLNAAQAGKLKQSFKERVHATFYESAGVGALTRQDVPALQALREQIAGHDGDVLDPAKRSQLTHQLYTWEKQIEGQRGREQDAATKMAVETVQKLRTFVTDGLAPDLPYQDEVRMLTRGTPWAQEAEQLIAAANAGAGFGSQTLPRQAAALAALEGKATSPEQAKEVAHARTIHEKQTAAYKDDPWEAGSRFQRLPVVVAQPITSPLQLLKIAAERIPLMNGLEAASGTPAPLLRPAEVAQAVHQLQTASIRDRTEILGQIGSMLSVERLSAFAEQLDKGNRPLALTLKVGAERTTAGRMASELVQIGAQALADKTVKKDDSALSGWRAEIATLVRGTLDNPQDENDIIDAAFFVRAAQELDGAASAGYKLPAGADKAVAMVVGMPLERGGVKTLLPRGMSESEFDTKARALLAEGKGQTVYLRGQPVTVESLANRWSSYGLRMVLKGEYMPISGNAPFTVDKEGRQPLRLKVQ